MQVDQFTLEPPSHFLSLILLVVVPPSSFLPTRHPGVRYLRPSGKVSHTDSQLYMVTWGTVLWVTMGSDQD